MEYSKTVVERLFDRAVTYRKELLLSAALIAVSSASIAGYFAYKNYVACLGHKAYASALQLLQARVLKDNETPGAFETVFTSSAAKWKAVAEAFGNVYVDYSHVGVGVIAGAAKVQALLRLGQDDEARVLLADVLTHITSPELRALYTLTYARLLIDSESAADQKSGVSLLAQLAATKDSAVNDSALYYLGLHYWLNHDASSAANYWKQLVMQYEGVDKKSSPWVGKAKEKLALIQGAPESV
ncbi:MAG: hypothetical protein QG604_946 [Candidatus Dependentiae bacterium]|nr:hypothetical protein [Candidatus Dependentiae bacterium]